VKVFYSKRKMAANKLSVVLFSLVLVGAADAKAIQQRATSTRPDWFQTSPDNNAG
jgi:hypothetical protein